MSYYATKCPCGHSSCRNWFVAPVAAFQGVGFTKLQAEAVAELLNTRPELGVREPRQPPALQADHTRRQGASSPQPPA